ncbi:MAG TPA: hypothetical protein VLR26_10945 [Frankiaceae bacterium]|nr:hypothetical protein [Frankiaceae bacterium]
MPRSVDDIVKHGDELAERFEQYEPHDEDERDPGSFIALRGAVIDRARAEEAIQTAVVQARKDGYSWRAIGSLLGTSGEAARQRYGAEQPA